MKTKLNTTGSMSLEVLIIKPRKNIKARVFFSYRTPVAYELLDNDVQTKVVIVDHQYSNTTSKHLSKIRDMFKVSKDDTYNLYAFIKAGLNDGLDLRVAENAAHWVTNYHNWE